MINSQNMRDRHGFEFLIVEVFEFTWSLGFEHWDLMKLP